MRIMVFLHGTIIMHPSAVGCSREERVRQVIRGDAAIRDFDSYVPIGNAVSKLKGWLAQGATICYLSSHQNDSGVQADRSVLVRHGFPDGPIYHRRQQETYADIAARILPDILIEDDCESIGEQHITYLSLPPDVKARIRSVMVKEFGGIDHLPDDLLPLLNGAGSD